MRPTWRVVVAATVFLAIGCFASDDDKQLSPAEVDEVIERFRASSFSIAYDVAADTSDRGEGKIQYRLAKRESSMLMEVHYPEPHDDPAYQQWSIDSEEWPPACTRRATVTGEQVCRIQDDQAWTLVLAPLLPVIAFLHTPESEDWRSNVRQVKDRDIAGSRANCYQIAEGPSRTVEFCLGRGGELLYQSDAFGDGRVYFTARDIEAPASDDDVEIPYRLVHEGDPELSE